MSQAVQSFFQAWTRSRLPESGVFHQHIGENAVLKQDIVGDGEDRAFLEKAVSDAQLHESIFFKGWASPEEVASYIQASDAVVIPSRSEGMPVIFWESMQMDTPVIVTDVGDMADYTREFGVGKVVPPENSNKLKESMRDFMEDKIHIDYDNIKALAEESSLTKAADTFLNTIVPHFHTKNASIWNWVGPKYV